MMHRNSVWLAFIALIVCSVIVYSGYTLYHIYQYARLTEQVDPTELKWKIISHNEETFIPRAYYQFCVKESCYEGRSDWNEHYLNPWTAEEAIDRLSKRPLKIWIDPHTAHFSSLQKIFPFKQTLYMIFLWLLLLYFVWLGWYVTRYPKIK